MQDHPLVWPFFHFSRSGPRPFSLPPDDTVSAGLARSVPASRARETRQGAGQPAPTFSPCPFCHGTDVAAHKPGAGLFWAVFCESAACGASGPLGLTEAEAVRGWNRWNGPPRPGLGELLAELARRGPDLAVADFGKRLRAAAEAVLDETYVAEPGVDAVEAVQARLRERLSRELRDFLDGIDPPAGAEIWPAPKCRGSQSTLEDSK